MLHPFRPGHFADVDQSFNALLQFDERSVVGDADHASVDVRAHGVAVLCIQPWIGRELFKAERDALLVLVVLQDLHLNLVADVDQVARVRQTSPRHVGNVQQTVDSTHINERTVLGQVLDDAGEDATFFEVFEGFAALLVLLFFQKLLARDHDVAALLVELDDGDFHRLALHAVQIADRTQVHLRAGQEGARALNIDGQAALDAFHDDALDRLLLVVSALNLVPRAQPLRFQVREVDVALFGMALLAQNVDLGAGLELRLALVIENFRKRHHAFGFRPDIDDDVGRGQFHHGALDYVVVANRFLGLVLEVMESGGEIVAGGHAIFSSVAVSGFVFMNVLIMKVVFVNVVFMKVRGGRLGFHGRGLCEFGSVYYGRAAGVGVMGSCHGFRSGFKVAGGAVVEQIHSLGIDASVRDSCGTWNSGLLAWSLGCVEADLADDPRTIPAGSKPRPIGTLRL